MRLARQALGVAAMSSKWIVRQPAWILQSLGVAAAFALMLYAWGGIAALRNLVIAWIISSIWAAGVSMVGQDVAWQRIYGQLDMFIASPLTPTAYLIGMLLGSFAFAPFILAPVALLAIAIGSLDVFIAAAIAALLLLPASMFTGLYIAMRIRSPANISALTNTVATLLQLLPPVFYPATALPDPLKPATLIAPTSAAAELARSLVGLYNVYPPHYPLAALAAWTLISIAAAARVIRWGLE